MSSKGGLSIRRTEDANTVALAKFNWRLVREGESLWARVIKSKYGEVGLTKCRRSPLGRSIDKGYKLISKGLDKSDDTATVRNLSISQNSDRI